MMSMERATLFTLTLAVPLMLAGGFIAAFVDQSSPPAAERSQREQHLLRDDAGLRPTEAVRGDSTAPTVSNARSVPSSDGGPLLVAVR